MDELLNAILYGKLDVEIPQNLTLRQQSEVVRALAVNSSAMSRLKLPKDIHPWVNMLLTEIDKSNNASSTISEKVQL
jgi:hypothetical protein